MGAWDKTNTHDGVGMGKHRFVAISKIQTPDFHVLVAAGGHQQGVVGRNVHGHHRQFVPVPVYDKLWWWWWWSVVAVVMVFQKERNQQQEQKNRRTEEQKNRRKDELIVTGLHDNANASASRTQRKAKKNTYMDRKNFKESSK
jgi:hypothetical protein